MSPELRQEAKKWLLRLQAENVSAAARAEFEAWIAADPRHGAAFAQVCDAVSGVASHAGASRAASAPTLSRRGAALGATGAAAAGFGVVGLAWRLRTSSARYETARDEQRELILSEGSRVALNIDSSLEVRLEAHVRALRLGRGEAFFEVVPDGVRPFEVEAGEVKVRALGTAFGVRVWDKAVEILVIDGAVGVTRGEVAYELAAGERVRLSEEGVRLIRFDAAAGARMLAWRTGMLHFDGEPLRVVVEEVVRYTGVQIVIADPELGDLGIVAYMRADHLAGFIDAVEYNFPQVEVVREGDRLLIRTKMERL